MPRSPRSIEVSGLSHNAPIPLGARVGNLLCSSGIAGKDPETGQLPGDGATQAALAFANLERLLAAGDATLADVVKLTIYVKDNSVREAINAEWLRCFPDPHDRPARHILVYELQHGMALQLECMAVVAS
ncbi:MAG TPA: RidA family protein [Burkholderiaceae bacterium]|nr:RidA family protein [Burkholderiaceae bacterium]